MLPETKGYLYVGQLDHPFAQIKVCGLFNTRSRTIKQYSGLKIKILANKCSLGGCVVVSWCNVL